MTGVTTKKFLSPNQIRNRFGLSKSEYDMYVRQGLPTYVCAGVVRHPIDEVYLWCETNRVYLQDQNDMCTRTQIRKLLGISSNDLEKWEKAGLPKASKVNKATGGVMYLYRKHDVIDWLKSQQNNVMGV